MMKLVQCIIRKEKLDDVVDKVTRITPGLTACNVRGHGRQKELTAVYRGVKYEFALCRKVMIEIITDDNKVDDVINAMLQTARTGGDFDFFARQRHDLSPVVGFS
jgi:nitrogen regulatory protein PII